MRKLFTFLLTMVLAISAYAVDVAYVVGEEFKSVASLDGQNFAIVNLTDAKAVYGSTMQVLNYGSYADAFKSSNSGFKFKLVSLATDADEAVRSYYLLRLITPDGKEYSFAWGAGFLNSQPNAEGKDCCFLLGLNKQNGQDLKNGAVWDVQYVEGKGFSLKNIGTGLYFKGVNAPANSEEPVYYSFVPVEYDLAANAKAAEAVKTSTEKQALADAKAAYEADKESAEAVSNYVKAIDAAIASINNCDAVKASFAGFKLSTLGTAAAKEVETKYNAGEYKDAAELSAAYVAAVKAQNCDGADMTGAIINASFELGNTNGWTYETSNDHGAKENSNGTYTMKGCDGKYLFNIWSSGNAISQAIEGLPNGTYKLQAVIATDADHKVQLNGNDKNTQIAAVDKGTGVEGEVEFEVTDGKATIGAEGVDKYWYKVDNFRLTLVKAANAIVPEKDAWYTGADFFRFRADKNAAADSPYAAFKEKVEPAWGAAPGEETNGCIVCKVPANVNPASQIWIRGAEKGQTFAKGSKTGFRVSFRVKADGEYKGLESQCHADWGYKLGGSPFGTLDVTTEWQTVSFVCVAPTDKEGKEYDLTDLCFNLSGDTERTFYFDDVKIEARGSDWYVNNEFRAKDYKKENPEDPDPVYKDGNDPYPAARFVSDAEGGYVEVISNAGASQTYNSQLWIAIPQEFVGTMTKMTIEVQASKAITCPESFQATATGNGWGCNPGPGKGVEFKVGEWTTIERVLNTKNVKSTGTWKNLQADQYCLDLSDVSDAKEAVTYKFRGLKFEQAYEDWYTANPVFAKDYTKGTETYTDGVKFPKAPYIFGNGDEGGYIEVVSNADATNDYASQIFFEIPEALRGKNVQISMKVKANQEISVATALHGTADGNGWSPNPAGDAVAFTVDKWVDIKRTFNTDCKDKNGDPVAYYVMNLSDNNGKKAIKYDFDEVAFDEYIDWGELEEVPVEGTLLQTQDWTAQTSYGGGWNILNENTTLTVKQGEGLIIENKAELETPYTSQFFVADGFSFEEGKQYAVRYTVKVQGEGSIRTDVNHWGDGVADDGVAYTNGYKQYVFVYGASPVTNNGYHVIFQPGKFVGKIILEKVELFDITPKYDEMEWTDNLFTNGDVEGEDMSAFIAKVNSDVDALLLPASTQDFKGSKQVVVATVAREKDAADETKYLGNDHDTQFFVRLPYALPKGTLYYFSVDYISNKVADVQSQTHSEPGDWKSNTGVGKITTGSEAQTLAGYFTADNDMRTIAFNLASAVEGGKFFFDNFIFKVVATSEDKTDLEDIKAFTAEWDKTSLWDAKFALNKAVDAGRTTETEGKGYTEESVKALTDAIAAGKAQLNPAEGADPVTAETLAAATKAIEDAIAGLTKGAADEYIPLPELAAAEYEAIPLSQADYGDFSKAAVTTGEYQGNAFTTYTASGQIQGAFKMKDIDVTGCDKIYIYFAKKVAAGWEEAFWGVEGPAGCKAIAADTEFIEFDLAEKLGDTEATYELDGKTYLKEATILTLWGTETFPLELNVYGIYKHKATATAIAEVEDGATVKDGKYFENGQIVIVKNGKKYTAAGVEIK